MPQTTVLTRDIMQRFFAAAHQHVESEKRSMENAVKYLEKSDRDRERLMHMPEGARWRGLASDDFIVMADCLAILENAEAGSDAGVPTLTMTLPDEEIHAASGEAASG